MIQDQVNLTLVIGQGLKNVKHSFKFILGKLRLKLIDKLDSCLIFLATISRAGFWFEADFRIR